VTDEKTVRGLEPDMAAVAGLASRRGLIVTAPAEDPTAGYDFVSRCFFPNLGIPEDPVTGSAHTALAPFWSERLGRTALTGLQASPRSGLVRTELRGERTLLTGHAVTVVDGELLA
jgi:predicted PhzF superfamily epimerase YddE/YHI9